ncbi:hypothetical protein GCM10007972_20970 [Iodidimonas muriae]|uniref:PBP domain-containing protein n=1 Tax=Iodidimonas muriae TaxID=261467 RepID=A0ABQ2LGJ8_9PROT|nr:hypothetical protein [Iodidimonas muriae]GER07521.1 hypothetical protein JCM17843_18310 [Kordiimonadales bacterium JCM 17843]GGO14147.1 hypothetical protein GCM10007972_20970 [Iodidimonas muriae]
MKRLSSQILRSLSLVAALGLGGTMATKGWAADYVVLVNKANPTELSGDAAVDTIRQLYLKELSNWPNGLHADPFAREGGSPAQTAFINNILKMSPTAVTDHWTRVKQTKGETPPREVGSERILFRLIGKFEGGFAIVSAEEAASAPDTVKVLLTFSD